MCHCKQSVLSELEERIEALVERKAMDRCAAKWDVDLWNLEEYKDESRQEILDRLMAVLG